MALKNNILRQLSTSPTPRKMEAAQGFRQLAQEEIARQEKRAAQQDHERRALREFLQKSSSK